MNEDAHAHAEDLEHLDAVIARIAAEIRALARSGHITACSGLPITQRVQTSGRAEPALAGAGELGLRALSKLGRLYAHGGELRRFANALWWTYSPERPLAGDEHHLALALALLLAPAQRREVVAGWEQWGKGPNARVLRERGKVLLERARIHYVICPEEPGSSGVLGELLAAVDIARSDVRALRRNAAALRDAPLWAARGLSWAELERVGRACVPERSAPVRCDSWRAQRSLRCVRGPLPAAPIDAQPKCVVAWVAAVGAPCRLPRRALRRRA